MMLSESLTRFTQQPYESAMLVITLWQDELQKVIALESHSVKSDSSNGSILFEVPGSATSDPITAAQYSLLELMLQMSIINVA